MVGWWHCPCSHRHPASWECTQAVTQGLAPGIMLCFTVLKCLITFKKGLTNYVARPALITCPHEPHSRRTVWEYPSCGHLDCAPASLARSSVLLFWMTFSAHALKGGGPEAWHSLLWSHLPSIPK